MLPKLIIKKNLIIDQSESTSSCEISTFESFVQSGKYWCQSTGLNKVFFVIYMSYRNFT